MRTPPATPPWRTQVAPQHRLALQHPPPPLHECCCRASSSSSSRLQQLAPRADEGETEAGDDPGVLLAPSTELQKLAASNSPPPPPQPAAAAAMAAIDWTQSADADVEQAVRALHAAAASGGKRASLLQQQLGVSPAVVLLPDRALAQQQQQQQQQHQQEDGEADTGTAEDEATAHCSIELAAAAATSNAEASSSSPGAFFGSRAAMRQQLQAEQLLVQRQHLLQQQQRELYRYTLDADSSSIVRRRQPGTRSPLKQRSFALSRQPQQQRQAADGSSSSMQQQWQQLPQQYVVSLDALQRQELQQAHEQQAAGLAGRGLPAYLSSPPQQMDQRDRLSSGSSSATHASPPAAAAADAAGGGDGPPDADASRGVCLSLFLYCCSRNELLSLAWQLGLPPAALRVVPRLEDADAVVHVKARPGERHYQYDEFRAKAAERGIPFIDLKCLSLLELQLYLLPVFRLYAGEVSPRDLVLRARRRGRKQRYTNIKLPRA